MDSISTPDMKNLSSKQSDNINNYDRYSRAEDKYGRVKVSFDSATKMKELDSILMDKHKEKDEVQEMLDEFQPKRKMAPAQGLDRGVKINGRYVAIRRIVTVFVILLAAAVFYLLFVPPFFFANDSESSCRYEDIFASKGITNYKAEVAQDKNVYNLEALSSDKSDSYRICTVAFDAKNMSPFAVKAEDYVILGGGQFKNNIVYSTAVDDSLEIPPFSTKTVRVEILVNRNGLSDEDFDEAITSLLLTTKGAKKQLTKSFTLPCLPALMSVSDVISFDPD